MYKMVKILSKNQVSYIFLQFPAVFYDFLHFGTRPFGTISKLTHFNHSTILNYVFNVN